MTSTTPVLIPIANMSMAADEISPADPTSDPMTEETTYATTDRTSDLMTEETTYATTLSSSESTVTEALTTHEPMTMQTASLEVDTSTRKPSGAIWKHMGLISVRVGRLLNWI